MGANDAGDFEALSKGYQDRFPGRVRLAGAKHGILTHIDGILNNTRPNPKRLVVAEGLWALGLAKKHGLEAEMFVFAPTLARSEQARLAIDEWIARAEDSYAVSEKVFERMSERDNADGLLAVCALPSFSLDDITLGENALVVVLDGLEIPGNIGTILRSVDGAGGQGVILCNRKARLTHPKMLKASQGSLFSIPAVEMELDEAMAWLRRNGFRTLLADTRADKRYWEIDYSGRIAIVAGSERYGMSREWYGPDAELVSIPMAGDCDSLNVAIATTILVYEGCLRQSGLIGSR